MTKFLKKTENLIFLTIVLVILILNIYGSIFMLASYWPCFDKNKVGVFLLACVACLIFFFAIIKSKINKKQSIIIIVISFVLSTVFRIILCSSFSACPTSDQWASLSIIDGMLNNGDMHALDTGNYFAIYPYLLRLIPLYFIPVKLFGTNYQSFYYLNSLLITASFVLLTIAAYRIKGYKSALITALAFNLFIPGYFLCFVIYGDICSLLFVSIAIFVFSLSISKEAKLLLCSFLFGICFMGRSVSVVWIIAAAITYLVFNKLNSRKMLVVVLSIVLFVLPWKTTDILIQHYYNKDISETSMPTINFIYIGTGYSLEGNAGIYNPLGYRTLVATEFDRQETEKILKEAIIDNINGRDLKETVNFIRHKIQNTWTDPDFETMGFVMPNDGYDVDLFVNEGYRLPVGTSAIGTTYLNSLGEFVYNNMMGIRDTEKIFVFLVLIISAVSTIIRIRNNEYDEISFFLQLNLVGFFLLQLLLETKPRYVIVSFILCILNSCLEVEKIKEAVEHKFKHPTKQN